MAINYFIGYGGETPQEQKAALESELRIAQSDLALNGQAISTAQGGNSVALKQESTIKARIREILRALNAVDPVTYPASAISPSNLTRIAFGPDTTT